MAKKKKVIQFTDTEKRHANLLIRLKYDGLNKSEFFKLVMTAYLERDNRFMEFVDSYRENKAIQSAAKRKGSKKLRDKSKETVDEFGLNENQIQNIFDIMEKEHPEL